MKTRLDPQILIEAMEKTGSVSYEELGWKFVVGCGATVRNYSDGKTMPPVSVLMILKKVTSRSLDGMIFDAQSAAARPVPLKGHHQCSPRPTRPPRTPNSTS